MSFANQLHDISWYDIPEYNFFYYLVGCQNNMNLINNYFDIMELEINEGIYDKLDEFKIIAELNDNSNEDLINEDGYKYYFLALCYDKGLKVPKNKPKAITYYRKAIRYNNKFAKQWWFNRYKSNNRYNSTNKRYQSINYYEDDYPLFFSYKTHHKHYHHRHEPSFHYSHHHSHSYHHDNSHHDSGHHDDDGGHH